MPDIIAMAATPRKTRRFAIAACDDLETGAPRPAGWGAVAGHAPYSYHAASDRIWLTNLCPDALDQSFLYAAQLDAVREVAAARPRTLLDHLPAVDWERARPLFVLSIGRCGSTLVSRHLRDLGWSSLGEPDVFDVATWDLEAERTDRVLWAAAAAWAAFAGASPEQTAFKFRSDLSSHVHVLRRAFPAARILFLTREIGAWAHSFVRAFGVDNRHLHGTLRHARNCLSYLAETDAPFAVIDHAGLARDPQVLVRALQRLGYVVDGDLAPRERHAQADERGRFEGMTDAKRRQVAAFLARGIDPVVPPAARNHAVT